MATPQGTFVVPICGALVVSTGKVCQCLSLRPSGRCGRHDPAKAPRAANGTGRPKATKLNTFVSFECSICMDECTVRRQHHRTKCGHMFHKRCLMKWKNVHNKHTCPLCRASLDPPPPPPPPVPPTGYFTGFISSLPNTSYRPPSDLFLVQPHETLDDAVTRVAALLELAHSRIDPTDTVQTYTAFNRAIWDAWQTYNITTSETLPIAQSFAT